MAELAGRAGLSDRYLRQFRVYNVGGGPCLECEWGVDDGSNSGAAYWPTETTSEWITNDPLELRRRILLLLDQIEWRAIA